MRKKIIYFIVASIVLQGTIFSLLNWKAEQLLNPFFRTDKAYKINIDLQKADSFGLSYNNRFLALIIGGEMQIIDLVKNQVVYTSNNLALEDSVMLCYKWLPDRNSLVFLIRSKQANNNAESLYSIDLQTVSLPGNTPEAKLNRIFNLSVQEVSSIEISTYTNNLYILYRDKYAEQKLCKIDIMKNINSLNQPQEGIKAMSVSNKFGTVYLQSTGRDSNIIYSLEGVEKKIIADNPADLLLGCLDEKVFIGEVRNNRLQTINCLKRSENSGGQEVAVWQGDLVINSPEVLICSDDKILFKDEKSLDIIYPDGRSDHKQIVEGTNIVLSPTGKMYLEIKPENQESIYYWRSLD